jgi:malonyl-CoA reductase/3-hydroxypropionate dehydrogenase (NADP+)
VAQVVARHGRIDVLVNNAGSAGPKRPVGALPVHARGARRRRLARGARDRARRRPQPAGRAPGTWCAPPRRTCRPGASVVNVSTIFSRTQYYGRAAYVVPKAALNALSRMLAQQLGPRGVRVNTVYPGPIESERIRTVFAAMDRLRAAERRRHRARLPGDHGAAPRAATARPRRRASPTPEDVATHRLPRLGRERGDERAQLRGHARHGRAPGEPQHVGVAPRAAHGRRHGDARARRRRRPGGRRARRGAAARAARARTCRRARHRGGVRAAAEALHPSARPRAADERPLDGRIGPCSSTARGRRACARRCSAPRRSRDRRRHARPMPLHGAVVLPAHGAWRFRGAFSAAADADVANFLEARSAGALAVARELTRHWARGGRRRRARTWCSCQRQRSRRATPTPTCCAPRWRSWCACGATRARATTRPGAARARWANQMVRSSNEERGGARSPPGRRRGCSSRGGASGR